MKNKALEKIIRFLFLFGYPFLLGLNAARLTIYQEWYSAPWALFVLATIYLFAVLQEQ